MYKFQDTQKIDAPYHHTGTRDDLQMDVMMPVARKDMDMLEPALNCLIRYAQTGIRRIYVVWQGPENENDPEPSVQLQGPQQPEVLFVDERLYPFSLKDIKNTLQAMKSQDNHEGWYYQQLLKLYAFRVLPGVLPRLLIHDADVAFTSPVAFIDRYGRSLLSYGYPFRWLVRADTPLAYGTVRNINHSHVAHARRLIPGWEPATIFSGMQHHQLLENTILEAMLQEAERAHGMPFWEAFIRQLDCSKWNGASEYVLYFHYALNRYPDRVLARHLYSIDIIHDADEPIKDSPKAIANGQQPDMIGRHGFVSLRSRLETMDYIPENLRYLMLKKRAERLAFRLKLHQGILQIEEWAYNS
ncbi:MAG: DUF6492 family protein [Bacteroidota bacterium]